MTGDSKVEKNRKKPGRQKGCEKTGGRKKGTPNKNSLKIREALDAHGFNVIEEFLKCYRQLHPIERMPEIKFIMKFMYPQLSEVTEVPSVAVNPGKANESTAKLLSMVSGVK